MISNIRNVWRKLGKHRENERTEQTTYSKKYESRQANLSKTGCDYYLLINLRCCQMFDLWLRFTNPWGLLSTIRCGHLRISS